MNAHQNKSLIFAMVLDLAFGDPPNRLHPVAWMGSMIARISEHAPHRTPMPDLLFGGCLVAGGAGFWAGLGTLAVALTHRLPQPFDWLAEGLLLKITFSLRGLVDASRAIELQLNGGNLPEARRLLSWHLVSRDTNNLDESSISAAVIESIAENACDGLVAPLIYYAQGGLPVALAYRFINTSDSMLGYHDAAREWLGKIPARLDDLTNLLPARLSGLLIIRATPPATPGTPCASRQNTPSAPMLAIR
jgi:adenosylcobinamide-phosphate synthase